MAAAETFARAQLEKYGWKEGKGLGKREDGIATALKSKLKLNNYGLGYDVGKEFKSDWWLENFNKISKNIVIENNQNGVQFKKTQKKNKCKLKTSDNRSKPYGGFVMSSDERFEDQERKNECQNIHRKIDSNSSGKSPRISHKSQKYGRHGKAKLIRLRKQERKMLNIK